MTKKNRSLYLKLAAVAFVLTIAGAVFATTQGGVISFWVDGENMTDDEVENEIEQQLLEGGMQDPNVEVRRNGNKTTVKVDGTQGDRQIRLVKKEKGGDSSVIQMHHEPLDTEREPGMTDDQLADKIRAQLTARGMTNANVHVNGDEIRVRVKQEVEDCGDAPCPPSNDDDDDDE